MGAANGVNGTATGVASGSQSKVFPTIVSLFSAPWLSMLIAMLCYAAGQGRDFYPVE